MPLNETVDWRHELGGGTRVALIQAGTFRSDAGALFGPVPRILWDRLVAGEIDPEHRLLQALNCLLVETPAGRVLVETGIGERVTDKVRTMRAYEGDAIVPALERAGFEPGTIDVVALSHLHFDHAGGLLRTDGSRAFRRARIVAQMAEWEIALDKNSRIVASYDQPEIRVVREWGEAGWVDGEREILPSVSVVLTGGHSKGHQAIVVRGRSGTVGFFGDLCMRPWSAEPTWLPSFDDFPLRSVEAKRELFSRAADQRWRIALSHEPVQPIGRLEREGTAFHYIAD